MKNDSGSAVEDRLDSMFLFTDYQDEVLREPKRGEPDTSWIVGMGADGEPIRHEWDNERPHLLIAGRAGSGKSGLVNSFLAQLFSNNHPDDVNVLICEPKNDLQAYQHLAHVKRFVDDQVTSASPWESAAAMFAEVFAEMKSRHAAFASHPLRPQKLSEAREIAQEDPEGSGDINFPYLFLVIEECATYFEKPPLEEDKPYWDELDRYVWALARESRAAGIHICAVTQYPTKRAFLPGLKQNSRRIGLSMADTIGSMVIIDQPGLERITRQPGRGMVGSPDSDYEEFRSLFLNPPGADRPCERRELIEQLPVDHFWPKLPAGLEPSEGQTGRAITLPDGSQVPSVPMP